MNNYIIRECTVSDAPAISHLNRIAMGYEYSICDTKKKLSVLLLSDKDKIFVAEINGIVVGYIHANDYDLLYAPHIKNIMGIAVSPDHRNCGIGKALLFRIEEWAKSTGAEGVRLVSGAERKEAHEFYKKCGFVQNKEQLNFKKVIE